MKHNIGRLDVTMYDFIRVEHFETFDDMFKENDGLRLGETMVTLCLKIFFKIAISTVF